MRLIVNSSGPKARELPLFCIATMASWVEKGVAVVLSGCVLMSHILTQQASGSDE